jgi:type I restriction enzyme R subunit/putative DNA methylase
MAGGKEPISDGNAELQLGNAVKLVTESARWRSRGYLPHFDEENQLQFLTFRLADSLPQEKLRAMEEELVSWPEDQRLIERRRRCEKWLDAGHGCCALRHPLVARVVEEALWQHDGERYDLLAWCVMPNHVHVLIRQRCSLGKILQSWKSFTGRWALAHNAELELGVPDCRVFWMKEYFDRFIRDEAHFRATISYIHENPVKAGLCAMPMLWTATSARMA